MNFKDKWNLFKLNTISFFTDEYSTPDGVVRKPNKANITAVLIAGFVGWLLLTIIVGVSLKRTLKKVLIIGMVFGKAKPKARARKTPVRRRRVARRRR
jgi:hypothetical protein